MSDPISITLIKKVPTVTTVGRGLRGYGTLIQVSEGGIIQWRQNYTGAPWNDIIALADLIGPQGDAAHIHIKWHAEASEVLLDAPDEYIGIYADNTAADSAVYATYKWFKYKGDKGDAAPNTIWQYSIDGTTWTTDATGALYERQSGDNGVTWSEAHEYPGVAALALKANVTDVNDALVLKADKAAIQIANRIYDGVDLTVKYAAEIAGYSDVWAWTKARITAANYDGLNIGDYIPFTLGAETIWAQIAGIDTYYRTGDTEIGHHIDFISKDSMTQAYLWNTTNINNGNADNAAPWMVSALKATLDGLVASLPAGLQSVVIEKRPLLETRYTSGSTLTNSTGWNWNNMGKLWVPSEHEVYGTNIWGTARYSSGQFVQYPIFANSYKRRVKGIGHNGPRATWWLASVVSGTSMSCCCVGGTGFPYTNNASMALRVPLCFRIG